MKDSIVPNGKQFMLGKGRAEDGKPRGQAAPMNFRTTTLELSLMRDQTNVAPLKSICLNNQSMYEAKWR